MSKQSVCRTLTWSAVLVWGMTGMAAAAEPTAGVPAQAEPGCAMKYAAIYPLRPRLFHIPANDPVVLVEYPFANGRNPSDLRCRATMRAADGTVQQKWFTLDRTDRAWVDLGGQPAGEGDLKLEILAAAEPDKVLCTSEYRYRIVNPAAVFQFQGKELNSMVGEVLNRKFTPGDATAEFVNFREGWVYLAFRHADPAVLKSLKLELNGTPYTLEVNANARSAETFRRLPAGKYALKLTGQAVEGVLIVRNVPMLFSYPLGANSRIAGNPAYDMEYHRRYIFPACAVFTGGGLPDSERAAFRDSGRMVYWNVGALISKFMGDDRDKLRDHILSAKQLQDPFYTGLTIDELFMTDHQSKALKNLAILLHDLKTPGNNPINTWIVGDPKGRGIYSEAIAAMINASEGRGMMLLEVYNAPLPDRQATEAKLKRSLIDIPLAFDRSYPQATQYLALILGNFAQGPNYRIDTNPAMDYKYFLDMQLNLISNESCYKLLPGIGYWGNYYSDDENLRWSFALLRHYAVEGRKDMLSAQYGYTYDLTYVKNPDFIEGLKDWTVQVAPEGGIECRRIRKFGKEVQMRWAQEDDWSGSDLCVMKRSAKAPNRIAQTITGLTPGKPYSFQIFAVDLKAQQAQPKVDLAKGEKPAEAQFRVALEGADILKAYRYATPTQNNCEYMVFTPRADTVQLTVSDWNDDAQAPTRGIGDETGFNFVKVAPYFEN